MTHQSLFKILTLSLCFCLSFCQFVPDMYSGLYYPSPAEMGLVGDKTSSADAKTSPASPACDNAIANANWAMAKLVLDLKAPTYQSNLYSEFDAVDAVSSDLKAYCKGKSLDLTNIGAIGFNATQDKACDMVMEMFVSLLEKKKVESLEGELGVVAEGRRLGEFLGDNCKPVLAEKKAKETDGSGAGNVKDLTKSAIDDSVEAAKTNLRIQKEFEKKGIEFVFGKDKKKDDGGASVGGGKPVDIGGK